MAKIRLAPGMKPHDGGDGGTRPFLLLATATAYARAARLALNDNVDQMMVPAYLLAGFSVEFSLKAFILQKTGDLDLTVGFGHKLRPAWAKAVELGLDVTDLKGVDDGDLDWMIDAFADHHDVMTFRYLPDVQPFVMSITPSDLIEGAIALTVAVARDVSIQQAAADASA